MIKIPIDEYVPKGMVTDTQAVIHKLRSAGGAVRMVQVEPEAFTDICQKIADKVMMPFQPTLCGVPCAPGTADGIQVIAVRDDNTNAAYTRTQELTVQL